jgi:hypothetical protein
MKFLVHGCQGSTVQHEHIVNTYPEYTLGRMMECREVDLPIGDFRLSLDQRTDPTSFPARCTRRL